MRQLFFISLLWPTLFMTACSTGDEPSTSTTAPAADAKPPVAPRVAKTTEQVGRTRVDHYAWLKDENWQQVMRDPSVLREDIRDYLEAENAYTKGELEQPVEALKQALFAEMRGRIKEDDASLPEIDGPWAYLTKYRTGGEYPIIARRAAADIYKADATDTVLLDGDKLGAGQAYFAFGEVAHSPNHALIAYAVDTQGSEFYDIRFRDAASGKDLPDGVPGTYGDFAWASSSDAIYWVERDDNNRPVAVHRYALGGEGSTEVYRESDAGYFVGVESAQSGEMIFITAGDHTTNEVRFFAADAKTPKPQLIAKRETGIEYHVEHWGDEFVIRTNADGAVDFKIVTASVTKPGRGNWTDLVAHQPGTLLLGMDALKNHLVRTERENALPRIVVRERTTGNEHEIAFDEAAYSLGVDVGYTWDGTQIRFSYSSPTTPDSDYDYDVASKARTLRKTREVPSGHNPKDYVATRMMIPARDGAQVPVTLLRHTSTPVNSGAPMLLYGYGSYGVTISARFRTTPLSLVDRGVTWAIVHPRGSMAKGYQWYLDGKLDKKQNTFNDYVDAARHLISEKVTAEGRIVGLGGSAGGLLMGAVVNQAPELFAGIIAAVPFVDVVNTMSDDTLPLTPPEWPEWGNPLTSAADYDQILAYSPYDQVSSQNYPAMLITGGLSDPRVTYWEPAKWAAKLRHVAPEGGPYYLRINMEAGHGGASGRFEGLKETALEYAFALRALVLQKIVND